MFDSEKYTRGTPRCQIPVGATLSQYEREQLVQWKHLDHQIVRWLRPLPEPERDQLREIILSKSDDRLFQYLAGNPRATFLCQIREMYQFASVEDSFPDPDKITLSGYLCQEIDEPLNHHVQYYVVGLLSNEDSFCPISPEHDLGSLSLEQLLELRNSMYRRAHHLKHATRLNELLAEAINHVAASMGAVKQSVALDDERPWLFFAPTLLAVVPDPARVVETILDTFLSPAFSAHGFCNKLVDRLYANLCRVSRKPVAPFPPDFNPRDYIYPARSGLTDAKRLIDTYLHGTTFADSLLVPIKWPRNLRFSHQHIIGGSGAGKTSLLEKQILYDLNYLKPVVRTNASAGVPPSLIIIDPHSSLVPKLAKADLGISDRLTLIDPRDTDYPPAINIFDVNRAQLGMSNVQAQERATGAITETLGYLFSGLAVELTGRQQTLFDYLARLMVTLPNPSLGDLFKFLDNPDTYASAINQLPEMPRDFFLTSFRQGYKDTRQQLRERLDAIVSSDVLGRILMSPVNKVDFFKLMNEGGVVLVDGGYGFLSDANSTTFIKFVVSLILRAVRERSAIPEAERRPCFVYIDEAWKIFDKNIDTFLVEARKNNVGLILAHHHLGQASAALQSSLSGSTAIKFASRIEADDAPSLARNMRTTPEVLLAQPRYQWAAYLTDVTARAVTIAVDKPDRLPSMADAEYHELLMRNRARIASFSSTSTDSRSEPEVSPHPSDDDISQKW